MPSSISLYTLKTTSSPFGTKLTGAFARFNMNDTNLEFVVKDTNGDALGYFPKTPIEYAAACKSVFIKRKMLYMRLLMGATSI
jgi:hypothetical protein